ncbi:MAG: ribose-phosphate pyrophosphokinase [Alphaproteobacteria bacterium]|nr:ribose-phosphate pyrophosphokinase [Alphaproteobacteria bacterium]
MKLILASTSTSKAYADSISKELEIPLYNIDHAWFKNGEHLHRIEDTVRGEDVYLVHQFSPEKNIDISLMELYISIQGIKKFGIAKRVSVVSPFLPYMRQDRATKKREPITAKLIADFFVTSGAEYLFTFDLHTPQIKGFFSFPVENLSMIKIFASDIIKKYPCIDDVCVVSSDIGGAKKAEHLIKILGGNNLAVIHKVRRSLNGTNATVEKSQVIGDVEGKHCILVDDMIDTGGTLASASIALKELHAKTVSVYATHPVFSEGYEKNINKNYFSSVNVSDSIPLKENYDSSLISIIPSHSIMVQTIRNVHNDASIDNTLEI